MPEALREESHSFIHREYSDEGGVCCRVVCAACSGSAEQAGKGQLSEGAAGQAPLCTRHQVLRH